MNWLDLCRNRPCIACQRDDGTIVPAHRNEGKGMGLKSPDWTVIPLCRSCHSLYDSGPDPLDVKRDSWRRYWMWHMTALMEAGLVAPLGSKPPKEPTYKRHSKILPRAA